MALMHGWWVGGWGSGHSWGKGEETGKAGEPPHASGSPPPSSAQPLPLCLGLPRVEVVGSPAWEAPGSSGRPWGGWGGSGAFLLSQCAAAPGLRGQVRAELGLALEGEEKGMYGPRDLPAWL